MQNIQGVRQNCYLLFLSWPKFPDFCLLVHVICIYSIDIKLQEDPPSNSKFCLSIDIDMERQNIEVDGGSSCSFMSMEEMQAVILTRQDKILMSFWTFGNNQPLTRQCNGLHGIQESAKVFFRHPVREKCAESERMKKEAREEEKCWKCKFLAVSNCVHPSSWWL